MNVSKITITEALAELKTIGKRIDSKEAYIQSFLTRRDGLRDPLEKSGGSHEVIRREMQSLSDLNTRRVSIRTAIQRVNQSEVIEILGHKRTIAEWLTWRKEVAPDELSFVTRVRQAIVTERQQAMRQGAGVVEPGKDAKPTDLVINVDEAQLAKLHEELETILGTLDGQLSLKNATVLIEV